MKLIHEISEAVSLLKQGQVIAYPTEAVYGLGCNPFNRAAVEKLLALKNRSVSKGLILLIANWEQLAQLAAPLSDEQMEKVKASWPGHVTWIFPKSSSMPEWLSGGRETIAIRMSAHPIAHHLSVAGPVVSTSANISTHEPAQDISSLRRQFPQGIDACLVGELGNAAQPSKIYDVVTDIQLR